MDGLLGRRLALQHLVTPRRDCLQNLLGGWVVAAVVEHDDLQSRREALD